MARQPGKIRSPAVHFPPPFLFVVGIAAGWAMNQKFPLQLNAKVPAQAVVSWCIIVSGISLMIWGLFTFRRARTAIYPNQPARELVANGPYRFSRNPMYVGLTIMTVGIGLLADNAWMLIMLPATLFILWKLVIQKEERYLLSKFGSVYEKYQQQVRRWI